MTLYFSEYVPWIRYSLLASELKLSMNYGCSRAPTLDVVWLRQRHFVSYQPVDVWWLAPGRAGNKVGGCKGLPHLSSLLCNYESGVSTSSKFLSFWWGKKPS